LQSGTDASLELDGLVVEVEAAVLSVVEGMVEGVMVAVIDNFVVEEASVKV